MRIEIEIPKEFVEEFNKDRFEESLNRLLHDSHLLAGKYEREVAEMLITAIKNAEPAYDVDKVVKELENEIATSDIARVEAILGMNEVSQLFYGDLIMAYEKAIDIVKRGGINVSKRNII